VEEETGILQVDDRGEKARVSFLVIFWVKLGGDGCEAGVEVEFEGFEGRWTDGCWAEGAEELAY
jgi:hypothetical protein